MRLGTVIGPIWGANQAETLRGQKLLRVALDAGGEVVAVDGLRAGAGDRVLVAHGSRVRDLTVGPNVAEKDIVVAIVDAVDRAVTS
jgi:ethanolamine utilization protein EutN